MTIRLFVHLESAGDRQLWWAESPDLPGFSASDDTLRDLLARSSWALAEIAEEHGEDPNVDVVYELVGTSGSDNPGSADIDAEPQSQRSDSDVRVAVAG